MIKVRFFGIMRLELGVSSIELEAQDVAGLLTAVSRKYETAKHEKLKNSVIFINDRNMNELKGLRTKLKNGDVVMFLSPVSGG
ncbi:MAG: MoaD/ThiS family protein [Bacillota bacterium]